MKRFTWTNGYRSSHRTDAQSVGEELEAIRAASNGQIQPEDVLRKAADKGSAMHTIFEWDDTEAAHQYRIEQARGMIRAVRVEIVRPNKEREYVRCYANVQNEDEREYRAVEEILDNSSLRKQLLLEAIQQLKAFRERYKEFTDAKGILLEIEKLQNQLEIVEEHAA